MSGGFFRGTSAEQDTRFSNKQAKLMKSQKFASELEHLVDITKVKMDVMRPWIATRVTELIGFEDEVLINFIYGLLDGKVVNGKEIQISLTGFMERNTGKFMKELWSLLLSAQNNASGVPQQFLDAKEEETKKKKAESDRITSEIQRRKDKESRELEQEKYKKTDAGNGVSKDADVEASSKDQPKDVSRTEEKQREARNGSRGRRLSKSPSADRDFSPRRRPPRSISKSVSNSRSYSNERSLSRSLSVSPKRRRRPSPSGYRVSPKRSQSPHRRRSPRRSNTPPRRGSSYHRRRPLSLFRRSSPSPRYRMRSPIRRRSRSPIRHRSRSPVRRRSRSPVRRRSRSPVRRRSRSPVRRMSRSPVRRRSRSPLRRRSRSPFWQRSRSPVQRSPVDMSPSPARARSPYIRRRSPVALRQRSPSPTRNRSPSFSRRRHGRSPSTPRRRSPSPVRARSPAPRRERSLSPASYHKSPSPQKQSSSPSNSRSNSPVARTPPRKNRSPVDSSREIMRDISPPSRSEHVVGTGKRYASLERRRSISPEQKVFRRKLKVLSPSPNKSLSDSEAEREPSPNEAKRSRGFPGSSLPPKRDKVTRSYVPKPSPNEELKDHKSTLATVENTDGSDKGNDNGRKDGVSSHKSSRNPSKLHKDSHGKSQFEDESLQKIGGHHQDRASDHQRMESNYEDTVIKSGNKVEKVDHLKKPSHQDPDMVRNTLSSGVAGDSPAADDSRTVKKKPIHLEDRSIKDRPVETLSKSSRKVEQKEKTGSLGTSSEESDEKRSKAREKRKNKRTRDSDSDDESSLDSYEEERKEHKRRRKEDKKMRKEERRRKRQGRRRKREERRSKKKILKSDSDSDSSASDTERRTDDDRHDRRRESHGVDIKEAESEQKKLEMQLREKALESLRAKKGVGV